MIIPTSHIGGNLIKSILSSTSHKGGTKITSHKGGTKIKLPTDQYSGIPFLVKFNQFTLNSQPTNIAVFLFKSIF